MVAVWPTVMDIVTEIAPGANPSGDPGLWTWAGISGLVRYGSRVAIGQGRGDEAAAVDAGSSGFVLDNRSGDFSTKNPYGQWYGLLARNTPLRQRLRPRHNDLSDLYGRTSVASWGTTTSGQVWTDVGAGGSVLAADWNVAAGVGTHSVPAAAAYRMSYLATVSETDVDDIRVTCTLTVAAAGGVLEPANLLLRGRTTSSYYMVRAEISATTQAITLRLYTPAGVLVGSAATGVTHVANTPVTVAAQVIDTQFKAKVWQGGVEPATWQLELVDDEYNGPGWVGVRTGVGAGNSNTKPVIASYDNLSVIFSYTVIEGTVPKWPPRWDKSRRDMTTGIDAAGVLRRLTVKNKRPLKAALTRAVTADAPAAYWPCNDGKNSTQAASAVVGVAPMRIDDQGVGFSVAFAEIDASVGDDKYPEFIQNAGYSGKLVGTVPAATSSTWQVEGWWKGSTTETAGPNGLPFTTWFTGTADFAYMEVYLQGEGGISVTFRKSDNLTVYFGVIAHNGADVLVLDNRWHYLRVVAHQDTSTTLTITCYMDGVQFGTGPAGFTGIIGWPSRIEATGITFDGVFTVPTSFSVRDLAVGTVDSDHYQAGLGYATETASVRLARLFAEQGERIEIEAGASEAMGPQLADTFINLARECETTDGGVLYERRFGLAYQPRSARYNKAVDLTVDFDGTEDIAEPPEPTDDDQRLRNYVEVKRANGSSDFAFNQDSIDLEGLYDISVTVNTSTDTVLGQHAGWRLHLGQSDELRWPSLTLDLRARPELLVPWLKTRVGSRIVAHNQPFPAGDGGDVDVFQEGYALDLGPYDCKVVMACSQASLYKVAVVEGTGGVTDPPLQVDTNGASITAGVDTTATSLTVASTGQIWTTTATRPADFPFDVGVSGEQMRVSAIASAIRETFTGSSGAWSGSSTDSGQTWVLGAGTGSLFTRTGSVGQIAVSAINAEHHIAVNVGYAVNQRVRTYLTLPVTPTGAAINWGVVLRRADATNLYWIDVQVGTTGSLTLRAISKIGGVNASLTTVTSATVHSTSVARILLAEIDADNVIRAKVWADGSAEPGWELVYDASAVVGLSTGPSVGVIARLTTGNTNVGPVNFAFDNFSVLNPQTFTVTRSVNGVVKAQSAGTPVSLWRPAVIAL